MTCSDGTHEDEANMTPEEIKNELHYLRTENAYLKAMREHLLRRKRQELEKKWKSSKAWGIDTASLTC